MKKILMNKKLFTIIVSVVLSLSILLIAGIIYKLINSNIKRYKNEVYSIKYDSTWKIKSNTNKEIVLKHKTDSSIEFSIIELNKENSEKEFIKLVEEVKYDIESKNTNYKLITSSFKKLLNNDYEAYQLLYETKDNQSMIMIIKKDNQLLIANYVSDNQYFDILLDSAFNIINNFTLLDEKIILKNNLKTIKTTTITYNNDSKTNYKEKNKYVIYSNHYEVNYSIPKVFKLNSFDSIYGSYKLLGKETNQTISIDTHVLYKNMYEYITDETSYATLLYKINELKKDDKTSNVKVTNEKLNSKYEGYIYKISYNYKAYNTTEKIQKIYMIYSLDYLRTFIIEIEASNMQISKSLIENIQLNSFKKYGSNVDRTSVDGYLKDEMKIMINDYSTKDKYYYSLKYSIPDKYNEQDNSNNVFEYRYFGYDYDTKQEDYKYDIILQLSSFYTIETYKNTILKNYAYDFYKDSSLVEKAKLNVNGKEFAYYTGGYTSISSGIRTIEAYLITSLESGGAYIIKVNTNYGPITEEMLKDFTSFEVEKTILPK